jgi:MoaA/NifB/PqqE/SkfB family radical SAM enzyme
MIRRTMGDRADVKVGFACNNRCVFCAQGDKRARTGLLPAGELRRRLRELARPGRGLVLTGGEPTMRRDLCGLVADARAMGFRPIQLQTNGRMLVYPGLVAALIAAGVEEFSPSLHGPTAEVHDALTRAPASFEQTARGIANAVASGAAVVTNTVVVRGNLRHLAATVELLASLGVRRAQLALVHPVGTAAERFEEVVPRLRDAAGPMMEAIQAGRRLGVDVVTEALPPCLLPGHEEAAVERWIPETTVVDLDGAPLDYSVWRRGEGKAKGPPCAGCAASAACEGPWREYPERHGWDDLTPIRSGMTR